MLIAVFVAAVAGIAVVWYVLRRQHKERGFKIQSGTPMANCDRMSPEWEPLPALSDSKKRIIQKKKAHCFSKEAPYSDLLHLTAEMMASGAEEGELHYENNVSFTFTINDEAIKEMSLEVLKALDEIKGDIEAVQLIKHVKRCALCPSKAECEGLMPVGHC